MISLSVIDKDVIDRLSVLIMDVDGVLTDGKISYTSSGEEIKSFNVKDGAGLKYWHRAGHEHSAIITGRSSPIVERRAQELGITKVIMGAKFKVPAFEEILGQFGVAPEQCIYIGDDLPDIPVMRKVGLSATVADAVSEVKETADIVTECAGGCGAVREVVDAVLKAQGRWPRIMERYLSE